MICGFNLQKLYTYKQHTFPASVLVFINNGESLVSCGADQVFHSEQLTANKLKSKLPTILFYLILFIILAGMLVYYFADYFDSEEL